MNKFLNNQHVSLSKDSGSRHQTARRNIRHTLKAGYPAVKNCCILTPIYGNFTAGLRQMATFRRRGNRTQAEVCVNGIRKAKTFESKLAARMWASEQELEISRGQRGQIPDKSFSDLLVRYARDVSVNKKGYRWEAVRIDALKGSTIGKVKLKDLDSTHVVKWRDERLKTVSGSTVVREKNLLCHACTIAIDEWKWLQKNPFHKVRMPKEAKARDRIMVDGEREKLEEAALSDILKEVLRCADFAVETGMRAGEICGLTGADVIENVATLHDTKNGSSRRVPLSQKAMEVWGGKPFSLTPKLLDVHWRKLTKNAGIDNLHFHDLRASCATRLSKILNPLQLAKVLGHKDLKTVMVYYRETAEDIAKKLG